MLGIGQSEFRAIYFSDYNVNGLFSLTIETCHCDTVKLCCTNNVNEKIPDMRGVIHN